jgi:hypothetical protein
MQKSNPINISYLHANKTDHSQTENGLPIISKPKEFFEDEYEKMRQMAIVRYVKSLGYKYYEVLNSDPIEMENIVYEHKNKKPFFTK